MVAKDAIPSIGGGVVSILILILSIMVLVDDPGNTFALAQLVLAIIAFCISFVLSVIWWRREREPGEPGYGESTPLNCCYNLLGFLVSISVIALSALILQSENDKDENQQSGIFVFASVMVAVAIFALLFFVTQLILWGIRKYRA